MKKLTLLFMSLMLFLGMGKAFADVIPPTFNPASGVVEPKQTIEVGVDPSYDASGGGGWIFLIWTFDATAAQTLSTLDFENDFSESVSAVQNQQYPNLYISMYGGRSQGMEGTSTLHWEPAVSVPQDLTQGSITLSCRFYAQGQISDVLTVSYELEGEAATIPAPSFNPAQGPVKAGNKVTLSGKPQPYITPSRDYISYDIAYALNDEDFDFNQYIGQKALGIPSNNRYNGPIVINETTKITAVIYEVSDDEGNKITSFGPKETITYEVIAAPAAPTFSPDGGNIATDAEITIATTTPGAKVYYTKGEASAFDGIETEDDLAKKTAIMEYSDPFTLEELGVEEGTAQFVAAAAIITDNGDIVWSTVVPKEFTVAGGENPDPTTTVAQPTITPDGSQGNATIKLTEKVTITCATNEAVIYYTLDKSDPTNSDTRVEYTEPFLLPDNTPAGEIQIRAVAVKDDVYSDGRRVNLMVLPNAPAAPTFNPDGGDIEASAGIKIATTTPGAKIYYIDGTTASFTDITEEDALDEAVNKDRAKEYSESAKPALEDYAIETPGETLSFTAAAALITNGNVTWSTPVTREFTVKDDENPEPVADVAAPVITPDNDAHVHIGDTVRIECTTNGATIYYTIDGTAPYTSDDNGSVAITDDAIEYEGVFVLAESMLKKVGDNYELKIRAVAKKDDKLSLGASAGYVVYPNNPIISPEHKSEVAKGREIDIYYTPSMAEVYYTLDGTSPLSDNDDAVKDDAIKYTGTITITDAMAAGENLTVKAVAVLGQYNSSVTTVQYHVIKLEMPETVTAPVFVPDPTAGKLTVGDNISWTMDAAYAKFNQFNGISAVAYVINGANADLNIDVDKLEELLSGKSEGYTGAREDGKVYLYEGESDAFQIEKNMNVKAVQILALPGATDNDPIQIKLSSVVDANYEVDANKLQRPVFVTPANNSTVEPGSEITFELPSNYDWVKFTNLAYILYVENDADVTLEGSAEDIMTANADEPTTPTAKAALGFKVIACQNDVANEKLVWTPKAVIETEAGDLIIRARLAGIDLQDNVYYSDVISVSCKVEKGGEVDPPVVPGVLPATVKEPSFVPVAGEMEKGQKIKWTWDAAYDGNFELVAVAYVINGKEEALDIADENIGQLWDAYIEGSTVLKEGETHLYKEEADAYTLIKSSNIMARLILGITNAQGKREIKLSPIVKADYTVKDEVGPNPYPVNPILPETVMAPTFVPAAGEVEKGTKVTWTWDTAYTEEKYPLVGVVYVVNGKDADLNLTKESFGELWDASQEEITVREEGKVYLYRSEADAYQLEKGDTIKARMVLGTTNEGLEIKFSDLVQAIYTIKGENVDPSANESIELQGVSIYPNPNNGMFNIELPVAATVEVFATSGALAQRIHVAAGKTTLTIGQSGIYFVRITGEGRSTVKRVIVR